MNTYKIKIWFFGTLFFIGLIFAGCDGEYWFWGNFIAVLVMVFSGVALKIIHNQERYGRFEFTIKKDGINTFNLPLYQAGKYNFKFEKPGEYTCIIKSNKIT